MRTLISLLTATLLFATGTALANNVQVTNVEIVSQDAALDQYVIEFDLFWENSWRVSDGPQNWDATWVFLKFTRHNQHDWHHGEWYRASDDAAADGHVFPAIARVQIPEDRKGAFIHRAQDGIGNFVLEGVQMIWDYSGEDLQDDAVLDISVHAIEMVYIPEGPFYLGDNGSYPNSFQVAGFNGQPFYVDSEDEAITLGGSNSSNLGNGVLVGDDPATIIDNFDELNTANLPADWPMGYHAMYVMKYEVTKAMYSEFFFTLTLEQNDEMFPDNCQVDNGGSYYLEFEDPYKPIACLTWAQIAAYLDWSGLRPLSETEYEKACRGPLDPVPNEYAWGTNGWYGAFHNANDLIRENEGEANEIIIDGVAEDAPNAAYVSVYGNTDHHVRVGIFAASVQNPTRLNTGATYYGLMEMTGNAEEAVISLSRSDTRDFSGLHGDGEVAGSGNASISVLQDWAFVNAVGVMRKGQFDTSTVSRRFYMAEIGTTMGFRACRTAP